MYCSMDRRLERRRLQVSPMKWGVNHGDFGLADEKPGEMAAI